MVEVKLPQFGMGMTEAVVTRWLKQVGDIVAADEPIVEIEADKTNAEICAPEAGRIVSLHAKEGETVETYSVLAVIGPETEDMTGKGAATPASVPEEPRGLVKRPGAALFDADVDVSDFTVGAKAVAKAGSSDSAAAQAIPQAAPRARRLAKQNGVDIAALTGTGRNGRVTHEDVALATASRGSARSSAPFQPSASSYEPQKIPLSGMRAAIARRMHQSLQESAQLTLSRKIDVTSLVAYRDYLLAARGLKVSYNDLIVRSVVLALKRCPTLNATMGSDGIHVHHQINIGIAVALDAGLMVPVLQNAQEMSLSDIKNESNRLAHLVRCGEAPRESLSNGTFTVSNLGAYGIESFTPIINPPEVAILGVGAIADHAVRGADGGLVWRKMISLSLTIDHRAIDGAPGAQFLQAIAELVAIPEVLSASPNLNSGGADPGT